MNTHILGVCYLQFYSSVDDRERQTSIHQVQLPHSLLTEVCESKLLTAKEVEHFSQATSGSGHAYHIFLIYGLGKFCGI